MNKEENLKRILGRSGFKTFLSTLFLTLMMTGFVFGQDTTYTITVSANPVDGGSVTGGGIYDHGQSVTLTAIPETGYAFFNWTEGGNEVSTDSSYSFTAIENRDLVANFTLNQYTIAVSANPADGGSVTGGGIYDHGQSVTLTAIPETGYAFFNWTEGGSEVSTDSSYSFIAIENRDLVANFALNQYTIAVSANPADGGSANGGGIYDHGQSVTLTAIPETGYAFFNWTEGGSEVSTDSSYSFTAIENRDLVANFIVKTYTITATSGDNGIIEPSGEIIIEHGEDKTFTITPDPDYLIEKLIIDGTERDSSVTFTFQNIQSNHSIHAAFIIQIPDIPQLLSPLSGTGEMIFNPELSWQTSNRAETYNLQVATHTPFEPDSIIFDIKELHATSYRLENLENETRYFWRVSATNNGGTSEWSEIRDFTTIRLPEVTTDTAIDIRDISATLQGTVVDTGQPHLTEHGFVWDSSANPDINDNKENLGSTSSTGLFTADLSDLQPGITYFIRTYATNAGGTVYGNEVQFTTTTAAQLVITQQPQITTAGQPIQTIIIEARDENDNLTKSFNNSITVILEDGPDNASLNGTTIRNASEGVVVFDDLFITNAGEGYRLRFTSPGLNYTISDFFSITPADPNYFIKISGDGQEGLINTELQEPFVVQVEDIYTNTVYGTTVLFEITQYPPGATGQSLSNTSVITDENGRAATTLTMGNSDGTYRVSAKIPDTDLEIIFTISIGGARLSGRVTEAGNPLNSVSITATWDNSEPIITLTDNAGFYRIPGIPNGATNVRIFPSKAGYRFAPEDTVISGPVTEDIAGINFVTTPPFSPELYAPENGAENLPLQVTLQWYQTDGADSYSIQVSETGDFTSGLLIEQDTIETLSFTAVTLEHGKLYYWRVRAKNPSGYSGWSDIWSFSVMPTTIQRLTLYPGWNMISSFIAPFDSSLNRLFEPVIDKLTIIKDGAGNTFLPEFGIDNIKTWNYKNGYQIYFSPGSDTLEIFGIKITPDNESLPLYTGWNMVGYLRNTPLEVELALEAITDKLIIIKNGSGQVYIPPGIVGEDPINTMGTMKPGEGYQIYISEDADLTYPGNHFQGAQTADGTIQSQDVHYNKLKYYHHEGNTGTNAIFIVKANNLSPGDEIGVWNQSGELVGNGVVQSHGKATVVVWGDNSYGTKHISGAIPGEDLTLTMWSSKTKKEEKIIILNVYDIITNTDLGIHLNFQPDAVIAINAEAEFNAPSMFVLQQNYPNPFNPSTTIAYSIPKDTHVMIEIYNMLGQKIETIVDKKQQAGTYEVIFDGSYLSSGTYLYRLQAEGFVDTNKFILLK